MIQQLADWITYDLLGLDATSHLGVALDFFIYDTVKILMLLFTISSLMGVVNAYFPIERLRNYLMTHRLHGMQYLLASVFGAITPAPVRPFRCSSALSKAAYHWASPSPSSSPHRWSTKWP